MNGLGLYSPVAFGRHDIVDAQLLADFLDAEMEGVRLQLLAGHVGRDGRRQAHEARSLILRHITPSVTLLPPARAVGFGSWFGVAATLQVAIGRAIAVLIASDTASVPQRGYYSTQLCLDFAKTLLQVSRQKM